jgi:hypothetical protein
MSGRGRKPENIPEKDWEEAVNRYTLRFSMHNGTGIARHGGCDAALVAQIAIDFTKHRHGQRSAV